MKVVFISLLINCLLKQQAAAEPTLKLVNVIFRHGDRTPSYNSRFPNDPYNDTTFYPFGYGALTNRGKSRIYKFGELLRERYKNLLGEVYLPELLYARSTDYDRTKMSLQLVLAALYPPASIQKWHDTIDWQPIPINYVSRENDDVLGTMQQRKFLMERKRVENKTDVRNRLEDFHEFMSDLSDWTGKNITDSFDIKKVYDTLVAESYMNLSLPVWTKGMFPKGKLYDGALLDCNIISYDNSIVSSLSGKLMLKITKDLLSSVNNTENKKERLFLYSGHEVNVISVLKALNIYNPHVPEYSSAVIIELFEEHDEHHVKVLYYQGIPARIVDLKMPGCDIFCPLEKYLMIVKNIVDLVLNEKL